MNRGARFMGLAWLAGSCAGADWPQFGGPDRNGIAPAGVALLTEFPAAGAKVLWQKECGAGFAGPVVSGGRVFLFHRRGDKDMIDCFDAATGKSQWQRAWATGYDDDFGFDDGPRSCPVVHDGHVFCYGADGTLTAIAAGSGKVQWQRPLATEFGSPKGFFGRSCSPLVSGNLVIVAPGGTQAGIAAFDCAGGALKWKAPAEEAGYASPILMSPPHGKRLVFFTREGVTVVDPVNGRAGPSQHFRSTISASVNAASPVAVSEKTFFTSASYGTGAALWEIGNDDSLTSIWRSGDKLDCHYATPVCVGGMLYGFHGRQESGQELRCVQASDGKVRWSQRLAPGHLIACGRQLIILTDQGELILTTVDPDKKPDLTQRASILRGGHRALPALADGLFLAKDKDRLVCIDLRAGK